MEYSKYPSIRMSTKILERFRFMFSMLELEYGIF